MEKYYILFNPHAGSGKAEDEAKILATKLGAENSIYDMTAVASYKELLTDAE